MYQDIYVEKSIKRNTPSITKFLNLILIVLTVFVAFLFLVVNYAMFGIPLIAMIIVTYFVSQNAKVEFDYIYTNGTLEITKIVRRRKRKDLIECEMKDVIVVAPSRSGPVQAYIGRAMKTYDCLSHEEGVSYYTTIVKDNKSGSEVKVLFEPGEEMLEAMHRISPEKIHI